MPFEWELTAVYDDREAWTAASQTVTERIETLGAVTPETLSSVLDQFEETAIEAERLLVYAKLRREQTDGWDEEFQQAKRHYESLSAVRSRLEAETASMDAPAGYEPVVGTETDRDSETIEETLQAVSPAIQTPKRAYRAVLSAAARRETEPAHYDITGRLKRGSRSERRAAYEDHMSTLRGERAVIGTLLERQVATQSGVAAARGHPSARAMQLAVPTVVHEVLTETVHANRDPLFRFLRAKRADLGVDQLQPWDLYAMPTDDRELSPEDAHRSISRAVRPLGEEWTDLVERIHSEGWVSLDTGPDVRSATTQLYDPHPFVRVSFDGAPPAVYSMAHEYAHAIHGTLASDRQTYFEYKPASLVAEIVSTAVELLVYDRLRETTTGARRRAVTGTFLTRLTNTLYTNAMLAAFEQELYDAHAETGRLRTAKIADRYRELAGAYWPVVDGSLTAEWMDAPHLFSPYSNHQYAVGAGVALAIWSRLRAGDAEGFTDLAAAGSARPPTDVIRSVGVDVTEPAYLRDGIDAYETVVASYEESVSAGDPSVTR